MRRRAFLGLALAAAATRAWPAGGYPRVEPGRALAFPRDYGSHPAFRTEWWYVTATLADGAGRSYGVQVTFFRNRPGVAEGNPSAFAPLQLVFAHAAIGDAQARRLLHEERAARAVFGLAGADEATTRAWIGDWSLSRDGAPVVQASPAASGASARLDAAAGPARYVAQIAGRAFAVDLALTPTQPVLVNGAAGYSRKGPLPEHASGYYSEPQLAVTGTLTLGGAPTAVAGRAWLDHEWSSEYLAGDAVGWDWTGINLDDGAALMAFRIRDRSGGALWAGGTLRDAEGRTRAFAPGEIRFIPRRRWRSPRTGIEFPVAMTVAAGERELTLEPWFDDFELDSRGTTGAIYWEGAVRAVESGRETGRGYLELTGYGAPLRL